MKEIKINVRKTYGMNKKVLDCFFLYIQRAAGLQGFDVSFFSDDSEVDENSRTFSTVQAKKFLQKKESLYSHKRREYNSF